MTNLSGAKIEFAKVVQRDRGRFASVESLRVRFADGTMTKWYVLGPRDFHEMAADLGVRFRDIDDLPREWIGTIKA